MSTAAEQRQALADITTLAQRELEEIWPVVAALAPVAAVDALADAVAALGARYGDVAATVAAAWYEEVREAAEAPGAFTPALAPVPDVGRWEALARWGAGPLFEPEPRPDVALQLVAGGLQRTVADQHRLTVVESSIADPAASGWRRVGVGDSCGFCRMLIDRGHVYTEAGVTFRSHDHCNCAASPAFAPNVVKVSPEPYRQSQRRGSAETKKRDNARAREFIRAKGWD